MYIKIFLMGYAIGFMLHTLINKISKELATPYPIIECMNGIFYSILFYKERNIRLFIGYGVLISLLIVMSWVDMKKEIIPDFLIGIGFLVGFIFKISTITQGYSMMQYILGGILGGGFLWVIYLVSNGEMGCGDIKLMSMLGFWFGIKQTSLIIFCTFFLGGIVGMYLLLFQKRKLKDKIPFGPLISLGVGISGLYGQHILKIYEWYKSLYG